jgi:diadenylate cyclase
MFELIRQIRWQDVVDIGIITFLIYRSLQIVRGSRAMQMIIGLAVILVAYVSSRALGLFTLNWILDNFLGSIILVIIVIFQSDIRRALTQVGSAPLFGSAERMVQRHEDIVAEVVRARSGAKRIHGNRHTARCAGKPRTGGKRVLAAFADP